MVFFLDDQGVTDRASGRPPADELANEFFLDKKCGVNGTHDKFFKWCYEKKYRSYVDVFCQGVTGSQGVCEFHGLFLRNATRSSSLDYSTTLTPSDNSTISPTGPSSSSTTPKPDTNITTTSRPRFEPDTCKFTLKCRFGGPGKVTIWDSSFRFKEGELEKISKFCEQELYGVPGWPLWLILLVILLVISAVAIAASLFWKYWLRRKFYGREPGQPHSTMGSEYTSAPYSSSSALGGRRSSSRVPSGIHMPSTSRAGSASRVPSGSQIPSGSRMPSAGRSVSASRVPSMRSGSVSHVPTARSGSVSRASSGSRMPSSTGRQSSQRSKR